MDINALHAPVLIGLALLIIWSFSERALHALGLHQPTAGDREQLSLVTCQIAWFGTLAYSLLDALVLRWSDLGPRFTPAMWIGAAIAATGVIIRLTARLTLGKQFSGHVQTTADHRLVTTGIYRHIRHPAYLAFLLLLIGFPLCFGSLGGLAFALVVGVPAIMHRIRIEEAALSKWFGESYREHAAGTGRMFPRLR